MPTRIEIKAECAPSINLLIENCCDPLIQEIISFDTPGLPPIGAFSDSDGNCWKLVGTTEDGINSIRIVNVQFGSCETCIADNPCPENLIVESCCSNFNTIFSGSLPGIAVGDTFSDNFGFCWTATGTTLAPINGIVSVNTPYLAEDCTTCLIDNECPDIYSIRSCCKGCDLQSIYLYTTLAELGGGTPGELFVDQFGFCWIIGIVPEENIQLLTGSFINYVSSYSSGECISCEGSNSSCLSTVFYTIQNCFTLQTEVVELNFGYPVGYSISISFTTYLIPRCYKIISWDNYSLPTKIVDTVEGCFIDCTLCS